MSSPDPDTFRNFRITIQAIRTVVRIAESRVCLGSVTPQSVSGRFKRVTGEPLTLSVKVAGFPTMNTTPVTHPTI